MATAAQITDRAKRYRAQGAVTGKRVCVVCGATGNEAHGEKANLAYGCRSCNGKLAAAFKRIGAGVPTNQYNPAKGGVPTYDQYAWAVSQQQHSGEHGQAGAVIHATPKSKRIEYAKRIARKAVETKRAAHEDRWNPSGDVSELLGEARTSRSVEELARLHRYGKEERLSSLVAAVDKRAKDLGIRHAELVAAYPRQWNPARSEVAREIDRLMESHPFEVYGLRVMTGAKVGHVARVSYRWEDGVKTKERLPGTSALQVSRGSAESLLGDVDAYSAQGAWVALLGSDYYEYGEDPGEIVMKSAKVLGRWPRKRINPAKRNPADASAEVFEEFHGHSPREVVTVSKKVHVHEHLAAAGTLETLTVLGVDHETHTIGGFKGALLAFNEDKNQLFIEGGDQSLDLGEFGIKRPHEMETLGKIKAIDYHADKTHLGDEGGNATYTHEFRTTNKGGHHETVKIARYPTLIYDVRNEQLLISGGSYTIRAEGIDV